MCLYSSAIYDVLDGKRISERWDKEGVVNNVQNCNLSVFFLSVLVMATYSNVPILSTKTSGLTRNAGCPKGSFNCLFSEHIFMPANQQL